MAKTVPLSILPNLRNKIVKITIANHIMTVTMIIAIVMIIIVVKITINVTLYIYILILYIYTFYTLMHTLQIHIPRKIGTRVENLVMICFLLKTWLYCRKPGFGAISHFLPHLKHISKPRGGCVPRCQKLSCFKLLARQMRSKSDSHVRHLGLRGFMLGLD